MVSGGGDGRGQAGVAACHLLPASDTHRPSLSEHKEPDTDLPVQVIGLATCMRAFQDFFFF